MYCRWCKSSLELNCEIVRSFDASSKKKAMTNSYVRCPSRRELRETQWLWESKLWPPLGRHMHLVGPFPPSIFATSFPQTPAPPKPTAILSPDDPLLADQQISLSLLWGESDKHSINAQRDKFWTFRWDLIAMGVTAQKIRSDGWKACTISTWVPATTKLSRFWRRTMQIDDL